MEKILYIFASNWKRHKNVEFDAVVAVQWWMTCKGVGHLINNPIEFSGYRHAPL